MISAISRSAFVIGVAIIEDASGREWASTRTEEISIIDKCLCYLVSNMPPLLTRISLSGKVHGRTCSRCSSSSVTLGLLSIETSHLSVREDQVRNSTLVVEMQSRISLFTCRRHVPPGNEEVDNSAATSPDGSCNTRALSLAVMNSNFPVLLNSICFGAPSLGAVFSTNNIVYFNIKFGALVVGSRLICFTEIRLFHKR